MQFPERMRKTNNLCSSRVTNLIIALIIHRVYQKRIARIPLRFNTAIAFLSTILFRVHDRWETEKMRSTRQEGRKSLGHGRERVQQRLRLRRRGRCFPWMPAASFDAFYPESWIPRVPTARLAPSTGTRTVIGPFQRDRRCTVFSAATIPL